jgi:triacylglycerol lipase
VVLAIVYFAYPRILLNALVALQRTSAGFARQGVQVQSWNVAYIDSQPQPTGDQETIVLVHGFGDTKDRFIELARGLTKDYRVVALDLPGFGETASGLDLDYSTDLYVSLILDFLDELKIGSAHLVGYSMGGMLAAQFVSHHPERIRTLTLLAPAGMLGDRASDVDRIVSEGEIPLTYRDRASLERLLELNFNGRPDIPDFAVRALLAEGRERADLHELIFRKLFNPSGIPAFEQDVAALELPALVIWGTEDRILDVSAADRWAQVNPNIRIVKLPGAGHSLIHSRIGKIQVELRSHLQARHNSPATDITR